MKQYLTLFALCISNIICFAGGKIYTFTYDDVGNRITVSYSTTCRMRDTTQRDTTRSDTVNQSSIIKSALNDIKSVTTPTAYPNPVHDYLILSLPDIRSIAKLTIIDLNGNLIYEDNSINTAHSIIRTCDIPPGYFTVIVDYGGEHPFVQKMIKQ